MIESAREYRGAEIHKLRIHFPSASAEFSSRRFIVPKGSNLICGTRSQIEMISGNCKIRRIKLTADRTAIQHESNVTPANFGRTRAISRDRDEPKIKVTMT